MSDSNSSSSGGIGLFGILFVVFLVLKLAEVGVVASWSWWAITAPLWGGFAFMFVIMIIIGVANSIGRDWR